MLVRTSFVVRIQCDDAPLGRAIAHALAEPLGARGARVTLDGAAQEGGDSFGVSIKTAARGLPGATVTVGVRDGDRAKWLVPLPVPDEPRQAAAKVLAFLERWGFIESSVQRRVPAS